MNTIDISRFFRRTCKKRGAPRMWETPLFSFLYFSDSGNQLRTPDLSEETYLPDASYSMT